jgi:putative transposase
VPQSLSNLLVHLIFSTANRYPWLQDEWRDDLHGYLGGIVRECGSDLLAVNSIEDHVHLLFNLPRTMAMAGLVKEVKVGSSAWIHSKFSIGKFHWQAGYGVFSVSESHKEAVRKYIADQRKHHRKVSFQEEYRRILERNGTPFDERYVWD